MTGTQIVSACVLIVMVICIVHEFWQSIRKKDSVSNVLNMWIAGLIGNHAVGYVWPTIDHRIGLSVIFILTEIVLILYYKQAKKKRAVEVRLIYARLILAFGVLIVITIATILHTLLFPPAA